MQIRMIDPLNLMRNQDQVASVTITWDWLHFCLHGDVSVEGIYLLRGDVCLKNSALADWPHHKLCFFWYTSCMAKELRNTNTVCDILFYVPSCAFPHVRTALGEPLHRMNLHWLSVVPTLESMLWVQVPFLHPSNTEKAANPFFRMTGRPEGTLDAKKWRCLSSPRTCDVEPLTTHIAAVNDDVPPWRRSEARSRLHPWSRPDTH